MRLRSRFRRTPLGVLRVREGEVLVIECPPETTPGQAAMIERAFASEGIPSVVLGGGLRVAAVGELNYVAGDGTGEALPPIDIDNPGAEALVRVESPSLARQVETQSREARRFA